VAQSRSSPDRADVMAAFTLAHLSDPHLPPLPAARLRDLLGKRALGYLNWTRNRHKYQRREVLDALVSDMQAQAPDHIAITGDLVLLGSEVNPILKTLRGHGIEVTALHSHMIDDTPHLFFMHFWANDDVTKLAHGLRAALDLANVKRGS